MSLRDMLGGRGSGLRVAAAVAIAAVALAGCTVRPLYGDGPAVAGSSAGTASQLAAISISEPVTRPGQEVRNHLIFLFGSGRGEPVEPRYNMRLSVASRVIGAAVIQAGTTAFEPTSSLVSVSASYNVVEIATGKVVATGSHTATSGFDYPRQQFAALRAQRDAENRAAREAAELVRLGVARQISAGS